MTGAYVYTPGIWPSLAAAVILTVLGLYSWRRRSVPGALPLVAGSLFGALVLLGIALETAAVSHATKIAWFRFVAVSELPAATAGTCFVLEYACPGRWLTRRNLTLIAIPPLLNMFLLVAPDAWPLWSRVQIGSDGRVAPDYTALALILLVYGVGLIVVNAAALLWLFARSPRHRWPVALILTGQIVSRGLFVADLVRLSLLIPLDLAAAAVLPAWITYAIALFGFRIFDPLTAARRTVIEQMDAGLVVFDAAWCVVSLNPAAERILGVRAAQARGKTWQLLRSSIGSLPTLPAPTAGAGASTEVPEMLFGSGLRAQYYAPILSSLTDYRGHIVGHLLLLRDVTGQRQAETRILEQQRVLATLRERERLGRELHDGAGQVLAYFGMQAQAIARRLQEGDLAAAEAQLQRLAEAAQEAHADIRESILSLKAVPAGEWSFLAMLKQYLARYGDQCGIAAELCIEPGLAEEAFSPECGVQLLRVIQEALANARKHSGARSVRVTLARQDREAAIVVEDDGVGFDPGKRAPSDVCGHYGLDFMAERMAEIGGCLNIQSAPGAGTQVVLHAPIRSNCEEAP